MNPSLRYWAAIILYVIALVLLVALTASGERSPWFYVPSILLGLAMLAILVVMKRRVKY